MAVRSCSQPDTGTDSPSAGGDREQPSLPPLRLKGERWQHRADQLTACPIRVKAWITGTDAVVAAALSCLIKR